MNDVLDVCFVLPRFYVLRPLFFSPPPRTRPFPQSPNRPPPTNTYLSYHQRSNLHLHRLFVFSHPLFLRKTCSCRDGSRMIFEFRSWRTGRTGHTVILCNLFGEVVWGSCCGGGVVTHHHHIYKRNLV